MVERYVWRDGHFRDKQTGEPMQVREANAICMPMIQSDIAPYKSPLGDHWIGGRREQRYELEKNEMTINEKPHIRRDKEEYVERKAKQARYLEKRKAGLV